MVVASSAVLFVQVSEMAVSELPGSPNAVWTVKRGIDGKRQRIRANLCVCGRICSICALFADEFDAYIVVSFVNATLVLSIGETVEEVTDSGFLGTTPTLSCSLLGDDALLQVHKAPVLSKGAKRFPLPCYFRFTPKAFDISAQIAA